MRDASSILRFSFLEILATNLGVILSRPPEGHEVRAVGPKELKVTLVGGHVFLAEVQQGSDPDNPGELHPYLWRNRRACGWIVYDSSPFPNL